MSIEIMKQVLESFEELVGLMDDTLAGTYKPDSFTTQPALKAITDFRKAVEQAEKQKPVAWSVLDKRTCKHWYTNESKYTAQWHANEYSHRESDGSPSMVVTPLYTIPTCKWVGLTDEDKHEIEQKAGITEDDDGYIVSKMFNLIENKLKEKNQ